MEVAGFGELVITSSGSVLISNVVNVGNTDDKKELILERYKSE
jgi:hypothetical protein